MSQTKKQWLIVAGLIGLAAVIRFWAIGSRPGYEWDEPVYTNIATHLAHFGVLQVKPDFGSPVEPYVYHPPFYFLMLAGWFKLVGAGVTSARVLAGIMSLVFLVLAYLFMRWYMGERHWFHWFSLPLTVGLYIATGSAGWRTLCWCLSWQQSGYMPRRWTLGVGNDF